MDLCRMLVVPMNMAKHQHCCQSMEYSGSGFLFVARAAADAWRCITVGAFASESNARAPRFWSRLHEPGTKAIDALCVLDWARSECPACCAAHGGAVFAFPHSSVVRATVEKACADRALCILLVPVAILSQHWGKLLAASVLPRAAPYADGFLRVKNPDRFLSWPAPHCAAGLAIFITQPLFFSVYITFSQGFCSVHFSSLVFHSGSYKYLGAVTDPLRATSQHSCSQPTFDVSVPAASGPPT